MSLNISGRMKIWEIQEDKGNYALVKGSSSRKDKKEDAYKYSDWGFVRFVGDAYEKVNLLTKGVVIELKGAILTREPYMKDGEKTWPKSPQMTVFNFEVYKPGETASGNNDFPQVEEDDDESIPF